MDNKQKKEFKNYFNTKYQKNIESLKKLTHLEDIDVNTNWKRLTF